MKTIAVVFVLCFVGAMALTDEQKAKLSQYKVACIAETGVEEQVVENAKAGNVAEDDPKLACFASCMLKKIGVINADASLNEEVTRQKAAFKFPAELVEEFITKCKDTVGANDCEKAANLVKCFKETKNVSVFS